jgi:integrase
MEHDNEQLIQMWSQWQAAEGLANGTITIKSRYVRRLAAHHDLATITTGQAIEWMVAHRWAPETRKSARAALRSFYDWAVEQGHLAHNPVATLRPVRVPPPCPNPTADRPYQRALAAANDQETLMLMLAAHCGLRRAEIAALHTDHLIGGTLRVTGKGGRTRMVPVTNRDLLARLRATPDGWVFPGRFPDTHVCPDYVGRRLSRLLGPGWTGHSLRHRYSSRVYGGSRNILALQKLLGHSSPETTQRYVEVDDAAMWDAAGWAA